MISDISHIVAGQDWSLSSVW